MTNRGKVGDTFGEEVELDEGKSSTGYELYHKDFSSAMAHAYDFAKKKYNIEIDPTEIDRNVAMGPKKPSSGKANAYRLLDKTGKKAIQVQVANLDNKRYELNMYKEEVEQVDEVLDTPSKALGYMAKATISGLKSGALGTGKFRKRQAGVNKAIEKTKSKIAKMNNEEVEELDEGMSAAQIKTLRDAYARIEKIDVSGQAYKNLVAFLDKQDVKTLKMLAGAKIKFISGMAQNRVVRKMNEDIDESIGSTIGGALGQYAGSKMGLEGPGRAHGEVLGRQLEKFARELLKKLTKEEVELTESHFKVGQRVKCIASGMKGTVTKVDPEEKGKYYTVKQDSGKVMKYAPDELKALSTNEAKEGASKEKENAFHKKLDKLVHKTFGHSSDEKKKMKEETVMVCKDCGDEFDKPTTDCPHDSHDPQGENWIKKEMKEEASGTSVGDVEKAKSSAERAKLTMQSAQLRMKQAKEREAIAKKKQSIKEKIDMNLIKSTQDRAKATPKFYNDSDNAVDSTGRLKKYGYRGGGLEHGETDYDKENKKAKKALGIVKKGAYTRRTGTKLYKEDINGIFSEAVKKKEASAKENKKSIKSGDKLSGKQEPIEINPEIKEEKK